jgi:hypothetical protein
MSAFPPLASVERESSADAGVAVVTEIPNGIKIIAPAGFLWARPGRATCGFLIFGAHAGVPEHLRHQLRRPASRRLDKLIAAEQEGKPTMRMMEP